MPLAGALTKTVVIPEPVRAASSVPWAFGVVTEETATKSASAIVVSLPTTRSAAVSNTCPIAALTMTAVAPASRARCSVPVPELLDCVTATPALTAPVMEVPLTVYVQSTRPLACITVAPLLSVIEAGLIVYVHIL